MNELEIYYKNPYSTNRQPGSILPDFDNSLGELKITKLTVDECNESEGLLTDSEILEALKTTTNNKSPRNDGLPAEFYKLIWNDIKQYLVTSFNQSFVDQKLSITQRRGIITLIPKNEYIRVKKLETNNTIKPGL